MLLKSINANGSLEFGSRQFTTWQVVLHNNTPMVPKIIFYIFILKKLFVFVARSYCLLLFLLVLTSSTSGNPLSRGDGSESKKVSSSFTLHYTSCSLPSPFLSFSNLLDLDMVSSSIIIMTMLIIIIIIIRI